MTDRFIVTYIRDIDEAGALCDLAQRALTAVGFEFRGQRYLARAGKGVVEVEVLDADGKFLARRVQR